MALVIEDGTGIANANSYINMNEMDVYLEDGPYEDAWDSLSIEDRTQILTFATFFLENRFRFYGQTMTTHQGLQWPRTKNWDEQGNVIAPGDIPAALKLAVSELAGAFAKDPSLMDDLVAGTGVVKSWSTEGLSISFDQSAANTGNAEGMQGAAYLLGTRYINVEFNLRSIATLKDVDWLQYNKQTQVRK